MKYLYILITFLYFFFLVCDSPSDNSNNDNNNGNNNDERLVGDSAPSFTEDSLTNRLHIDYTLDTVGAKIKGSLKGSNGDTDGYVFNTGTFSHIDVQVYLNGIKQESSSKVTVTLDALEDDGYSALSGRGYFINAWIQPNMKYVLAVMAFEASDDDYVVEFIGR